MLKLIKQLVEKELALGLGLIPITGQLQVRSEDMARVKS